jgi:hypothetical protein
VAIVFLFVCAASWQRIAYFDSAPSSAPAIRASIEARLHGQPGLDLVMVSQDLHDVVFNAADIDRAPIVWAHELTEAENRRLIEHFVGRRVWRASSSPEGARLEAVRPPGR